jgi:nucleotide-binding universal stress UspA family protein
MQKVSFLVEFCIINFKKHDMKTILFPTDFSSNADHASEYAGMVAKRMNANVVLLNIYTIPTISEYQLPNEIENFLQKNKNEAISNVEKFSKVFLTNTGLPAERVSTRVEYGFVPDKIVDTSKAMEADLIVMGTKGASNFIDKWIGTNAQKVMKHSICPVWIIPQSASIQYPQHFLYAADFQEDEVLATHKLVDLSEPFGAMVKVVHIHDYYEMNIGNQIHEIAHKINDAFLDEPQDVTAKNLNRANIIEGLETYIRTNKPDVLALAIHEKSFFERIFDTSITKHFVQEAHLPILTFKK